jgi:quinol-cytochrome oxidoreductase complex cytochrome b subunit
VPKGVTLPAVGDAAGAPALTDCEAMSSQSESPPARERIPLARAHAAVLAIVTLQVLVLVVTGVVLCFTYRPSSSARYGELLGGDVRSSVDLARGMSAAHLLAARSAVPTALVAGVLAVVRALPWARRRVDMVVGAGLVLVMVVGSFTGHLLAWDQLGLRAVSVADNIRGYVPLFDDDQVRFVLVGGAEVAPATLIRWLLFHMLVVGSVLGALLAVAWRRAARQHDDLA